MTTQPDTPLPATPTLDKELDDAIKELYAIRSKMMDEEDAEGGLMPEDQRTLRLANKAIDVLERCERDRRPVRNDELHAKLAASAAALAESERLLGLERARTDGQGTALMIAGYRIEEAEKRAETAERELLLATSDASSAAERVTKWIEQARQEGYERGKIDRQFCECGMTLSPGQCSACDNDE